MKKWRKIKMDKKSLKQEVFESIKNKLAVTDVEL